MRYLYAFALTFALCANAYTTEVEPFVVYSHLSDVTRGRPFNGQDEAQSEYIGAGITIVAGKLKRFEIDISHGRKSVDRAGWESGSQLNVRFYPRRRNQ
jgi:hypothetical protein